MNAFLIVIKHFWKSRTDYNCGFTAQSVVHFTDVCFWPVFLFLSVCEEYFLVGNVVITWEHSERVAAWVPYWSFHGDHMLVNYLQKNCVQYAEIYLNKSTQKAFLLQELHCYDSSINCLVYNVINKTTFIMTVNNNLLNIVSIQVFVGRYKNGTWSFTQWCCVT